MPIGEVKPKPPVRTVAEWEAMLSNLAASADACRAELGVIAQQRRAVALAAAGGNAEAVQRAGELNAAHGELVSKLDTIALASAEADDARRAAQASVAERAAAAVRAQAQEVARDLLAASAAADEALAALAQALNARGALTKRLADLGHRHNRLHNDWGTIERACGKAGLRLHLPMSFSSARDFRALAHADEGILSGLLSPAVRAVAAE